MRQKVTPTVRAAMGVAGRKTEIGRAKHKPLMIPVNPKIGPSAVSGRSNNAVRDLTLWHPPLGRLTNQDHRVYRSIGSANIREFKTFAEAQSVCIF